MISKTYIIAPKLRRRQLNAVAKVLFFLILSCSADYYLANGLSTHCHFDTKLMLITARSSTTTQHIYMFKLTLVNWSYSQHSVVALRREERHFLILYTCAHVVSFPLLAVHGCSLVLRSHPPFTWPGNEATMTLFASGECEKDVGMGLWQHVNFCFHALILPRLHTSWHSILTSFYIFLFFSFF